MPSLTLPLSSALYAVNREVHLYIGIASASEGNIQEYPAGERHAILVLVLQSENSPTNWEKAEEIIRSEHWNNIELKKTGKVLPEMAEESGFPYLEAYNHAMQKGSAMIVYKEIEP